MTPLLGDPRIAESEIEQRHKDIAYAVQEQCELAMLSVVRWAVEKTRCRNLCLAGGVTTWTGRQTVRLPPGVHG